MATYLPKTKITPNMTTIIEILRQQLPMLTEQYYIETVGLFGSYVRHEEQANSDLDVLITFHKTPCLFTLIELQYKFTDMLGLEVDLVMKDGLKPGIAKHILAEVVPIQ